MFIYKYVQHLMKNTEFHIMLSIMATGASLVVFGILSAFETLGSGRSSESILLSLFHFPAMVYFAIPFVWFWMFHFSLCVLVNMTKWFGARTLFIAAAIGLLLAVRLVALTVWIFNFAGR